MTKRAIRAHNAASAANPSALTTQSVQQPWGALAIGQDAEGHLWATLENSRLRAHYGFLLTDHPEGESAITAFVNKRLDADEVRSSDGTTSGMIDACAVRGVLTHVSIIANTPAVLTVRLEFTTETYEGYDLQDISIFPDSPYIKVDYQKHGVNVVDIATPGGVTTGTYAIYGAEQWKRGYELYEHSFYNRAFLDINSQNITGVDQPGPLNYHGWFVMSVLNAASGRGYGRLAPVNDVSIIKLLVSRGFELFPHFRQERKPYTSYIFLVEGRNAHEAVHTGLHIADAVGAAPSVEQRAYRWLNPAWRRRLPLYVESAGAAYVQQLVAVPLDLHAAQQGSGRCVPVDPQSLRLTEVNDDGVITDAAVPCHYQAHPDAANQGVLTFRLAGTLDARAHRYYYLYCAAQDDDLRGLSALPAISTVSASPADPTEMPTISVGTAEAYA